MSIRDKVVLITGATGSLGRTLTGAFASGGARLALGVRRMEAVDTVQRGMDGRGIAAFVTPCDLRFEEDVIRMVHRVIHHFGRIDVVINAAAAIGPKESIEDYPVEPWRQILATNLTGTFLVCREVMPWMKRQGSGCILNVTSSLSKAPRTASSAYMVSQCAVECLSQLLAAELKGTGVRVNTVDVGLPPADDAEARSPEWVEVFLMLAEQSVVASGQLVVAAQFAKPSASV